MLNRPRSAMAWAANSTTRAAAARARASASVTILTRVGAMEISFFTPTSVAPGNQCSRISLNSASPSSTHSAMPMKKPVETTPGMARINRSKSAGLSWGSRPQSKIWLPSSVRPGCPSLNQSFGLRPNFSSSRRTSGKAWGTKSTGRFPRSPKRFTRLPGPTRKIRWRARLATTFSLRSQRPLPLIRSSAGLNSSAPSTCRSRPCSTAFSRLIRGIPSARAKVSVSTEVGNPTTWRPFLTRAPRAFTNAVEALPDPRPSHWPGFTKSSARSKMVGTAPGLFTPGLTWLAGPWPPRPPWPR